MSSCLRGSSFFRRRDSFEEEDVGGKGVVKKIPIEMKQRRTLATSLRSVGSFGPKRQKGASLRSALSVELDGQETEKIKKEFEMYRLNKENEIANFKKKEQKLESENRRLRGELQEMHKTVTKLHYERDEAYIHEQQALERSATFEAERDKIQRQFKIFREGKEEELQTILRTKRELERRLSSNRGRPGSNVNNNNVTNAINNSNSLLLNNIVETEISCGNRVGSAGTDGPLPLTETSLSHHINNHNQQQHHHQDHGKNNNNSHHRNSVDWWMMGQSPCFDREPSIGSMTQLNASLTLPAGCGIGGIGGIGGERTLLGSAAAHRKVSSTSSLLFGGGRGGIGGGGYGVVGGEGLGAAEMVSVSQFGTPAGLDVGGGGGGGGGEGAKDDWARNNGGGGGSFSQSRNSQIGFEAINPCLSEDSLSPAAASVFRLYVSAPSDARAEVAAFQRRFVPRLQRLCARRGRTLLFIHLPPDEQQQYQQQQQQQPPQHQQPHSSSAQAAEELMDIEVSAALHSKLPKAAAIFLSFLHQRLDTFTKDELHYGFLRKKESKLLGAVFCFREPSSASNNNNNTTTAQSSSTAATTTTTTGSLGGDFDDGRHRTLLSELTSLKAEIVEAESEAKKIFRVSSAEEAVDEAGRAIDALLRRSLGVPDNLRRILSDDDEEEDDDMEEEEMTRAEVGGAGFGDSSTSPFSGSSGVLDRESTWMTRLTAGASGVSDLLGLDLEHEETLRESLDSVCELGFESHYRELTSHLTSAGPLPPLLISGQPGTGKSLLLAKWLSLVLEERKKASATTAAATAIQDGVFTSANPLPPHQHHRRSSFYPHPHHFPPLVLFHSVADSQSVSGDPHHAIYRFTAKLLRHIPGGSSFSASSAAFRRVTSNPQRLLQEFPKLLESVSSRLPGGVVLVLDGADRFKDAESQLAWLLDPLPVDVRVFVAADEDACPKSWKSWPTLTVESLANNGVRELLVAAFKAAGRNLLDADSLNLIQRHCRSPSTTTPLYVSVLAAFLGWKSTFEPEMKSAVVEALENDGAVELMKHVLKTVDEEYDGRLFARGTLRRILAVVSASRSGVCENDVFRMIRPRRSNVEDDDDDDEKDDDDVNDRDDRDDIAWHSWAVIVDVLVETRLLRHRGGVLTLASPLAREAVRQVYLLSPERLLDVRRALIDFYQHRQRRRPTLEDPRATDELLWLLWRTGDRDQLRLRLRKIDVFVNLFARGRTNELLRLWSVVGGGGGGSGVGGAEDDKINALSAAYLEELKTAADAAEIGGGVGGLDDDGDDDSDLSAADCMTLTRVAAIYEAMGRFFRDMAFFDHASTPLERALELRESLDPDSAEVGRSLVQLAQLNAEWRKYSTAEALFRNALELFEGLFGSEHLEVASALEAMALLYQRQGKHDVSRPLQRRADSIKLKKRRERIELSRAQTAAAGRRGFGGGGGAAQPPPPTADVSQNLPSQFPEMPVYLTSTTTAATTDHSPTTAKPSVPERKQKQIASTFFNLGVRLCQQNKHANAQPLFQGALTVFEGALGPAHPLVAKTLRNLALVKYHLGEFEAAAGFYKRAIEMEEAERRTGKLEEVRGSIGGVVDVGVGIGAVTKLSSDSRRSSSDTMSTIKVGDESAFGHPRAASTR